MKALSVKQPWAYLLVAGAKMIEVRSWRTDYREPLLLCASSSPRNVFVHEAATATNRLLPAGCIVGIVDLVDVRPMRKTDARKAFCPYVQGMFAWVVRAVATCQPEKVAGRLHLYEVPDERIQPLAEKASAFDYPPPQGEVRFTATCPVIEIRS
jgi:hypothetical protein